MGTLATPILDHQGPAETSESIRVSLDMPKDLILWLDQLKVEFGLERRGAVVVRLLQEIRGKA